MSVCSERSERNDHFYKKNDIQINAIIKKDNFIGLQFHPEKSSNDGEQLLKNFLNL